MERKKDGTSNGCDSIWEEKIEVDISTNVSRAIKESLQSFDAYIEEAGLNNDRLTLAVSPAETIFGPIAVLDIETAAYMFVSTTDSASAIELLANHFEKLAEKVRSGALKDGLLVAPYQV